MRLMLAVLCQVILVNINSMLNDVLRLSLCYHYDVPRNRVCHVLANCVRQNALDVWEAELEPG